MTAATRRAGVETLRVEIAGEEYLLIGIPSANPSPEWAVTPAERMLIDGIAAGLSNRELALQRGTAPRTVANQLQKLYRKLGVSSRGELRSMWMGGEAPR